MNITEKLKALKDEKYKHFSAALIPTVEKSSVIGVRMPEIRRLAKTLGEEEKAEFLAALPHKYHEENLLHAIIIGGEKNFDTALCLTDKFLPFIDNWAVCDSLIPKAFSKNKAGLSENIKIWLKSDKTYTVRFGLKMIMTHFLDGDFSRKYLEMAANTPTDEYYLSMMVAWLFATALAKQYESTVSYIENRRLDVKTHNRAIQKAVESFRITSEQKEYLKTLKYKEENKNA